MEWYIKNADFLDKSSVFFDFTRQIGYGIVDFLRNTADFAEELIDDAYSFLNILEWGTLTSWLSGFEPVAIALLVGGLIAVGIIMMVNAQKTPNLIHGILLYGLVIVLVPILIGKLNDLVISGKNAVLSDISNASDSVVNNNIIDLLYADQTGHLAYMDVHYPESSSLSNILDNIDVTEKVHEDTEGASEKAKEYFSQYIFVSAGGTQTLMEFDDKGWLDIFDPPWYYRFHVNWMVIYMELIAFIIACACTAFKVIKLIYEIIVGQLVSTLFAANLSGQQKTIKSLCCIRDSYIVLFLVAAFIRIYFIVVQYINASFSGDLTAAFFVLCASFCVIDGPNVVEKILGIDAGLSSGFANMTSTYFAMRTVTDTLTGVGDLLSKIPGKNKDSKDKENSGGKDKEHSSDGLSGSSGYNSGSNKGSRADDYENYSYAESKDEKSSLDGSSKEKNSMEHEYQDERESFPENGPDASSHSGGLNDGFENRNEDSSQVGGSLDKMLRNGHRYEDSLDGIDEDGNSIHSNTGSDKGSNKHAEDSLEGVGMNDPMQQNTSDQSADRSDSYDGLNDMENDGYKQDKSNGNDIEDDMKSGISGVSDGYDVTDSQGMQTILDGYNQENSLENGHRYEDSLDGIDEDGNSIHSNTGSDKGSNKHAENSLEGVGMNDPMQQNTSDQSADRSDSYDGLNDMENDGYKQDKSNGNDIEDDMKSGISGVSDGYDVTDSQGMQTILDRYNQENSLETGIDAGKSENIKTDTYESDTGNNESSGISSSGPQISKSDLGNLEDREHAKEKSGSSKTTKTSKRNSSRARKKQEITSLMKDKDSESLK